MAKTLIARKGTTAALQTSAERFSKAFHANPSGMIITRLSDGRIIDVNLSYQRLLGFTAEELIGGTLNIHDDPAERQTLVDELIRNGFVRNYESTLHKKSGEPVQVIFSLQLIEIGGEQCIITSLYDITERKRAEDSLRAQEHFLIKLNEMTRTILLSQDFNSTLTNLTVELVKLFEADDCYFTRWDEERQLTLPAITTVEQTIRKDHIENNHQAGLTSLALNAGHALAVSDVFNSPYISSKLVDTYPARSVVAIPLIAGEHKLGAAIIAFHQPHDFTPEEISQAEQAGNQLALALWNIQQSREIQQRLKESQTLADIGRALSEIEHVGSDQVLQLIVDSALDLILNAEQAVIHIVEVESNSLRPMAISGFTGHNAERFPIHMQMGKGIAGQVIRDGIIINISDVESDSRFLRASGEPAYRSLMVAPITSGKQQIGTISVQSKSASAFSKKDEKLLNALAIDAAIAIENTRSFEETRQRLKEVNSLYGIIKVLAASLDAQELAINVVALLQKNFSYYFVQLFLVDPLNGDLVFKAGSGEVGEQQLKAQFRLPRGAGIPGHVAETGVPFITKNVNDVVFFERNPLLPDTLFELTVPIKIGQDVIGILDVQDKPPKQFTRSDLQLVQAVGDQLAVALYNANLYTDLQNAMKLEQDIRSQLIQSERLALVGRLLASVSHELNNPLQAIQNALFLLKEEHGLSSQGRQDLGIVLSEAERMAALIERLRSAYRPIRGKDFQPVELNQLIEDVYALIGTHMRHKDIAFEFFPDPNLHPVSGISDQLRQVVLNLFLNAVEVMRPGGHLTVQTQNLFEKNEVYFSVKDTGPGIEAEILPRIFDAFITSKHTGTGLGLTITHDILEQHRGRIIAENHPQGGAVFRVWLPMAEKE